MATRGTRGRRESSVRARWYHGSSGAAFSPARASPSSGARYPFRARTSSPSRLTSTAMARFENRTPKGVVDSCDWVHVENDLIKEIRSFYDSAMIREVLSPAEQESLDGSY